jgi:hypothetical protein
MEPVGKILTQKSIIIVNNDNKKILNPVNDINSNKEKSNTNNVIDVNSKEKKGRYELDRSKFTPNNEKTQLAEEIATKLNDLENYAFYLNVVNKIGCQDAMRLMRSVESDIEEKKATKTPVRSPKRYFVWKYKNRKY